MRCLLNNVLMLFKLHFNQLAVDKLQKTFSNIEVSYVLELLIIN